jgi:hypothetical protein
VRDAAGNESPMSPPLTVTIDRGAGFEPSLDLLPESDTGASDSDNVTRDNTPTIGVYTSLGYFRMYRDGVLVSGLWETGTSFTCPPVADGLSSYYAIGFDAAGNASGESTPQRITIDTTAPVSGVQPLPASVTAGPLQISWAGADPARGGGLGSGVISYDVYLSVDNAPYTLWRSATTATSDTYAVETGHSYRFYSSARDVAGNAEAQPTNPDAATSVGLTAPTVLSAVYDQNAPVPTSGGRYVAVRFSANVRDSLELSDVTVTNLTTGQTITPKSMAYDDASNTAVLYLGGNVPDGNYVLKLSASGIFDDRGVELDGNADGSPGGDALLSFFSLGGDANRNRVVDFNDLVKLAQNYNTTGKTWADGDFTGDGNVDFNDLVVLAQRYNTSLPAPSDVVGAAAISGFVSVPAEPMPSFASVLAQVHQAVPPTSEQPGAAPDVIRRRAARPAPSGVTKPASPARPAATLMRAPSPSPFGQQRITPSDRRRPDVLS